MVLEKASSLTEPLLLHRDSESLAGQESHIPLIGKAHDLVLYVVQAGSLFQLGSQAISSTLSSLPFKNVLFCFTLVCLFRVSSLHRCQTKIEVVRSLLLSSGSGPGIELRSQDLAAISFTP